MYRKLVLSFLIFAIVGFPSYAAPPALQRESNSYRLLPAAAGEIEIYNRVNRERARFRLPELEWNEAAARLARSYSVRMARERFFEHIDPEGDSVVERAERSRLRGWSSIGENLFMCTDFADFPRLAVSGWLRSSSHRQNMLGRNWTSTGIGVARGRNGTIYVTQIFLEE